MEQVELTRILGNTFDFVNGLDDRQNKIIVKKEDFKGVVLKLKNYGFDMLSLISSVDYEKSYNVIYHFLSTTKNKTLLLEVFLYKEEYKETCQESHKEPCKESCKEACKGKECTIETLSDIYPSANWLEREVFDLMGIKFKDHKELTRILLPLDWEGYPLRKDYEMVAEYHGIKR
ncbi:MAG: NADH-quinone oxidoreductase subunit C [Bdellovibrionota bacterium]